VAKKVGLSFAEVNELRVSDLLDLAKAYTGSQGNEAREADQSDIDAFFGG